jgi:hypothetical protein
MDKESRSGISNKYKPWANTRMRFDCGLPIAFRSITLSARTSSLSGTWIASDQVDDELEMFHP